MARAFSADSLLYGAVDSEILFDDEAVSRLRKDKFTSGNVLVLGSPEINSFARETLLQKDSEKPPIEFLGAGQFKIKDRVFSDAGESGIASHSPLLRFVGPAAF